MNGTISPELDKQLADMIRNHPAQKTAAELNAQVQQNIAHTNAAVEAARKIKVPQEELDKVAQASAEAKAMAADMNARLESCKATFEGARNFKYTVK